jgi:glycosyltransferase involved in cell wall biosynthesis
MPVIGNRAKLVLTVSEFARKSIAANGIAPAEKIRVVYNGTDHILQTQSDLTVLSRIGVTPGRYLLAVGSTKGYKNMRVLFDALQMAPSEFPLVVAGGGNQQDFTNAGLIIPPHVRFTGRVTDQELRGLYENASVFLFPSRTEGFGLPPLEAMQCGCPVVSARAGAMPEVCGDGAILVSPDEPAEWVEAIRAATTDTKRQELLARGRQRAQLFTWEKAARMLQDALTEVALEPARAKVAQPAA